MKIEQHINLKFFVKLKKKKSTDRNEEATSTRMKEAKVSKSQVKAMMIIFFNIGAVIMIDWVPECQMVNQKYYLEVLTKL
jgi:hypothetical protein